MTAGIVPRPLAGIAKFGAAWIRGQPALQPFTSSAPPALLSSKRTSTVIATAATPVLAALMFTTSTLNAVPLTLVWIFPRMDPAGVEVSNAL